MSFDYFSIRRMTYFLEKIKNVLGSAAYKNVPSSGNASTTEVVMGDDTRLTDSRTPTAHTQASDTINAMTNYSKPQTTSAIITSDTLNGAIGKLEKALDNKNELFTITLTTTLDPQTGEVTFTSDKLPSEVVAAKNNGSIIRLTVVDEAKYYFDLSIDHITEEETGFIFTNVRSTSNHQVVFVGFNLIKDANSDTWASIEFFNPEFNEPIIANMWESSGEYSCDVDFNTLDDAYYSSTDMIVEFGSEFFRLVKYDSSEDTFYFSNTTADSSGIKTRTFVMVGDESENEWTSITLTESSGDPSAIKWNEASTSVKKNYMQLNKSGVSQTINGITFTVNSDMSVTINGTATDTTTFYLTNAFDISKFNGMYLSGNPIADASVAILRVEMISSPWTGYSQYGDIDTLIGNYSSGTNGTAFIRVFNGKTVNNVTIKPMIRLATIEDSTYAPYIPDNTELMRYTDNNILGAKNLLPTPYADSSKVQNGITWTYNSDGTVVANGTATGNSDFYLIKNTAGSSLQWLNGKILSGVFNGSLSTYYLYLLQSNSPWTTYLRVYDGESVISGIPNDSTLVTLMIRVTSGTTASNLVFKPMIRLATDTDSTYVPYAKTNLQLTKDLAETSKNTIRWNEAKTSVKKNWLTNNAVSQTINGLTFTVNADKGITINGTATAITDYVIAGFWNNTNILVPSNSYTLSLGANPVNEHINIKAIYVTTVLNSTYTSGTFNAPNGITEFFIRVDNGAVINNVTVHPMLRLASIEDDTYVPYIPDNTELVDWKSNGVLGAKNLLNLKNHTSVTTSGNITYTINSDGSVSVDASTANANAYFPNDNLDTKASSYYNLIPNTRYIASFGVVLDSTTYIQVYKKLGSGSWTWVSSTNSGTSLEFTTDSDASYIYWIRLCYISSKSVSATTLYPMIRLASDTDTTYQPYAMTNRQLTELIPVWSSSVSALTGATSVTITNANIHTTSVIEPFADNGTNTAMSMPTMTVTEGQCVLGFDALAADTSFKLRITN